jgi:hypothetical protein
MCGRLAGVETPACGWGIEHIIGDIEAGAPRRPPHLTPVDAVVRNADVYDFDPLINRRATQQA